MASPQPAFHPVEDQLAAYAAGTYQRNRIWRNEESLFYDVTIKSPANGRGLMNYGLTQMEKGETQKALDMPAIQERLSQLGVQPMPMSVDEFGKFFREDVAATVKLAKDIGIVPTN